MSRILSGTRYLILVPILGLLLAASMFFVLGGIGLIRQIVEVMIAALGIGAHSEDVAGGGIVIFEVVEYVHLFLVGTVLYITAVGLYQLFVKEIDFPRWLKIDSTEELETNLIGVTVVVLAVNFMGAVFAGPSESLLNYGAAIALPIAALGIFVGLRAWSVKIGKDSAGESGGWEREPAAGAGAAEPAHGARGEE